MSLIPPDPEDQQMENLGLILALLGIGYGVGVGTLLVITLRYIELGWSAALAGGLAVVALVLALFLIATRSPHPRLPVRLGLLLPLLSIIFSLLTLP